MPKWEGFYTSDEVARLTGVPLRTLRVWRKLGYVRASVELTSKGEKYAEGYSYSDLTWVRILRALREHRLNFKQAKLALQHMRERLGPMGSGWANEHVYVTPSRIFVERPDPWGLTDATGAGQKVEERLLGDYLDEFRDIDKGASLVVPKAFRTYVSINPSVMGGQPVVRGTRVPTAVLKTVYQRVKDMDKLTRLYRPITREYIEQSLMYERNLDAQAA